MSTIHDVRPRPHEVAVVHLPSGGVARVHHPSGPRDYVATLPDMALISTIPGDRKLLGWEAVACYYGGLRGLRNGHHARDRHIWHQAAKTVQDGGIAYVVHEQQDWHGKAVWVAVSVRTDLRHLHLAAREHGSDEMALSFPLDADAARRVLADAEITNPALLSAIDTDAPSAFVSGTGGQVGVFRCDGDCEATTREATRAVLAAEGTGGR